MGRIISLDLLAIPHNIPYILAKRFVSPIATHKFIYSFLF